MGADGNPDPKKSNLSLDIDLELASLADFEADCLAVFYGMADDERWTVDEVKKMQPPGAVAEIAEKVYQMSGVSKQKKKIDKEREEEVERFRD